MGLSAREQLRWWGIGLLVLILLLWFLSSALLPFLIGAAAAYFLDPVADRLERAGFSRTLATVVITVGGVLVLLGVLLVLIPTLLDQIDLVIRTAPEFLRTLNREAEARFPDLFEEGSPLRNAVASAAETLRARAGEIAQSLLASSLALVQVMVVVVIAPVVTFYLLMDWDRMLARIDSWLPREHAGAIRTIAGDIDAALAGFVRGQLTVCAILGIFYAVALMIIGLQFGLLIGLFAGLISFIPFIGAILGGVISIGVAIFQFWNDPIWIAAVAGVFAFGQAIEGNVLTPNLVGQAVKLHPVWLMLALSVFGTLFGIAGMLIAVPLAATLGVLGRFGLGQYLEGRLYLGPDRTGAGPPGEDRE
ncbi:MAG: AI-2E family transporter [Pseudomonadota bacterium]